MHRYQAFDLHLSCELSLPELMPDPTSTKPDFEIRFGTVTPPYPDDCSKQGIFYQTNLNSMLLNIPKVACFLIHLGKEIIIDPYEGVDESLLRTFVLDCCFKALLAQKGLIVLQGSGVVVNNQATIFLGPSGFGKSTLCSLFAKKGYFIITEEICAIDKHFNILPGFPRITLWGHIATQLGVDFSQIKPVRPSLNKYSFDIKSCFQKEPVTLKAIYTLGYHKHNTLRLTHLNPAEKVRILQQLHRHYPYISPSLLPALDYKCIELAAKIDVVELLCPRWDYSMNKLGLLLKEVFPQIEEDVIKRGRLCATN